MSELNANAMRRLRKRVEYAGVCSNSNVTSKHSTLSTRKIFAEEKRRREKCNKETGVNKANEAKRKQSQAREALHPTARDKKSVDAHAMPLPAFLSLSPLARSHRSTRREAMLKGEKTFDVL